MDRFKIQSDTNLSVKLFISSVDLFLSVLEFQFLWFTEMIWSDCHTLTVEESLVQTEEERWVISLSHSFGQNKDKHNMQKQWTHVQQQMWKMSP